MQSPTHPETFDTRKLSARRAREAAARRAEGERLAAHVRRVVPPVLRAHGVERAWLFGSLARGTAHARSDVDLLVLGVGAGGYWELRHDLELALERPLDLITQDDDPVFVAKARARGVQIYGPES